MDNTTSFNICVDSDILKQCEAMYGKNERKAFKLKVCAHCCII